MQGITMQGLSLQGGSMDNHYDVDIMGGGDIQKVEMKYDFNIQGW